MPVRTVAAWGGVHEWTVDAAADLISAGHNVTFVGAGEVFQNRAEAVGASFREVDWEHWADYTDSITPADNFDLIFAHAPHARQFALQLNERLRIESHVMIHGAYHDFMFNWADRVDSLMAASPSLVHFCQRFGRVEPWKVTNVPNAAPDAIFDLPLPSLESRLEGGVGRIITAARLSKDKLPQIEATIEAVRVASSVLPDVQWVLDVYGDGPLRPFFEQRYSTAVSSLPNASVEFHGWVAPDEVPRIMNHAVIAVTAGMAGMRALAAGTLTVGVGARNFVGVQHGRNLRAGLWSNFGDHGIMQFTPTPLETDLQTLLQPSRYEEVVRTARDTVRLVNSQSYVNSTMRAALRC